MESQVGYMQCACTCAAGTLAEAERVLSTRREVGRMRLVMTVCVEANKSQGLPDFEQRTKQLLGAFFNVRTVRFFFYDKSSNTLLVSAAGMRKKEPTAFRMNSGVIGLCAQRQEVMHVPNISKQSAVDPVVDGLRRAGRPVSSNAAMVVGPLVVAAEDADTV